MGETLLISKNTGLSTIIVFKFQNLLDILRRKLNIYSNGIIWFMPLTQKPPKNRRNLV